MFGVNELVTINPIKNPKFTLMYNDSIEVPFQQLQQESENSYRLEFDYRVGKFTVWVDAEGHEEAYKEFRVSNKRNTMFGIGTIYMQKEFSKTLREATVQATRIKMVSRGDTIVYDAAAFELAEGSMLDALVAQLPGAELKDGQIKVNGKFIESLMVNGEDFFAGNPKVALENLPAYTVKNIKVYDRAANDDYLRGKPTGLKKAQGEDEHPKEGLFLRLAWQCGRWLWPAGQPLFGQGVRYGLYGKVACGRLCQSQQHQGHAERRNLRQMERRMGAGWRAGREDGWFGLSLFT